MNPAEELAKLSRALDSDPENSDLRAKYWTLLQRSFGENVLPSYVFCDKSNYRPFVEYEQELPAHFGSYIVERVDKIHGDWGTNVVIAWSRTMQKRVRLHITAAAEKAHFMSAEGRWKRLRSLDRHGLLSLLDWGIHGESLFFAFPYLNLPNWEQELKREAWSLSQRLEVLQKVAVRLQLAHDHGLVHGELKLESILLDGKDPIIADFDRAWYVEDQSALGELGRPCLPMVASPEQLRACVATEERELYGEKSALSVTVDVYQLGQILYELLTFVPPFPRDVAGSFAVWLAKKLSGEYTAPSTAVPELTKLADEICEASLAVNPARRYSSVREFAEDLAKLHHEEIVRKSSKINLNRWIDRLRSPFAED